MKIPIYLLLSLFLFANQNLSAQKFDWINHLTNGDDVIVKDVESKDENLYISGVFFRKLTIGGVTINTKGNMDVFLAKYDTLGNFKWIKTFISNGFVYTSRSNLSIDEDGNVFLSGEFRDSLFFGVDTLIPDISQRNYFTIKINKSTSIEWAKKFGFKNIISGYNPSNITSIKTMGSNLYVYGMVTEAFLYEGMQVSSNKARHFLVKIDKNGNLKWDTYIKMSRSNLGYDQFGENLAIDKTNSLIYIAGHYLDTLSTASSTTTSMLGNLDLFIAKYDTSGNFYYFKSSQDSTNNRFHSIDVDIDGGVYIAGYQDSTFYQPFQFRWGSHIISGICLFVLKLDQNGDVIWDTQLPFSDGFYPYFCQGMSIGKGNDKNIFLSGIYNTDLVVNGDTLKTNGQEDLAMIKLDSNGKTLWGQHGGGASTDYIHGVDANEHGSAYFIGSFNGLASFGTRVLYGGLSNSILFKLSDCKDFQAKIQIFGDSISCSGTLSSRLKTESAVGYNYQWLKNGDLLAGENFPNFFPTDSGSYSVIVNNNGCIDTSRNITLIFDTIPSVSLQAFDTICTNDTPITLMGGLPLGGVWSGQGVINGVFDPSLVGTGNVKITYSIFNNSQCADSASRNIYVSPAPTPLISGQKSICQNFKGAIYSTSSGGPFYTWSVSGGTLVSGQGTDSITVDWGASAKGVVNLSETNSYGCKITVSDTVEIADTNIITSIVGPDSICFPSGSTIYSIDEPSIFYNWNVNGGSILSGQSSSSVKVDWNSVGLKTLSVRLFNSCGTDSTFFDTVYVSQKPNPSIIGLVQVCENSSGIIYNVNNNSSKYEWKVNKGMITSGQGRDSISVDWFTKGMGKVSLIEIDTNNCTDSTNVNVNIKEQKDTFYAVSICYGSTFNFGGKTLTSSGTYYDTLNADNGCDSISQLKLTVKPQSITSITVSICMGSTYQFNGQSLSNTGIYYDTLNSISNCDSIISLNLKILPLANSYLSESICSGTSYLFAGKSLSVAGNFKDTLIDVNGCDSIVNLTLSLMPSSSTTKNVSICANDSYFFNGQYLNTTGIYKDTLIASNTCDSLITLNLNVLETYNNVKNVNICFGGSYLFKGQTITTSGTYFDTLTAINGCDSLITLNLNISHKILNNLYVSICSGGSYIFNNQNLKTSGIYYDTLMSVNSCDSIIILDLYVLPHSSSSINDSICSDEQYKFGNNTYSQTGIYKDTLISANGCDSVITLNLSVLPTASSSINDTICSGEQYLFGSNTYTQIGIYKDTLISANGCDSVITLKLSVLPTASSSINDTICSGEQYLFGNNTYTQTGIYKDTMISENGCDSVITLNLSVLPTASSPINDTICSGEQYLFGNKTYTQTGIYKDTLISANGCDSVITLNLNVLPTAASSINASICSNDTYFFAGQHLNVAGTYTDTLTANNSCDSVLSLNLTVLDTSLNVQQVSICSGDNYLFNGKILNTDGIYIDTLINTYGCDSIVAVELEVDTVNVTISTYTDSLVAQATSASYQWLECDTSSGAYSLITGATNASYKAITHGSYAVEVTQNNCKDTSVCIPVIVTGINESPYGIGLNVYPNPTAGILFVEGDLKIQDDATITIFNMLGEIILQQNRTATKGKLKTVFNIENYPKGMYFIQITTGEEKFVKKIVLQ